MNTILKITYIALDIRDNESVINFKRILIITFSLCMNKDLSDLETRLRLEFQTQLDQIKELIGKSLVNNNNKQNTTCSNNVEWYFLVFGEIILLCLVVK